MNIIIRQTVVAYLKLIGILFHRPNEYVTNAIRIRRYYSADNRRIVSKCGFDLSMGISFVFPVKSPGFHWHVIDYGLPEIINLVGCTSFEEKLMEKPNTFPFPFISLLTQWSGD